MSILPKKCTDLRRPYQKSNGIFNKKFNTKICIEPLKTLKSKAILSKKKKERNYIKAHYNQNGKSHMQRENVESSRRETTHYIQRFSIRLLANFPVKPLKVRSQWDGVFKVLK